MTTSDVATPPDMTMSDTALPPVIAMTGSAFPVPRGVVRLAIPSLSAGKALPVISAGSHNWTLGERICTVAGLSKGQEAAP